MKLFELFDKPYPFTMEKKGNDVFFTNFSTPEVDFRIIAEEIMPGIYDIAFSDSESGIKGVTGSQQGNAAKVFSTVAEFIKQLHPTGITFSGDTTPSRQKLYRRLGKLLASENGWLYEESVDPYGHVNITVVDKNYSP